MDEVLQQFSVIRQLDVGKERHAERAGELRDDAANQFDNADAIVSQFCRKSNRHMLAPKGLE
jgi:Asp-tRNA(Asn)/Glu-tRNA(Gln) amidotransferase C subunit